MKKMLQKVLEDDKFYKGKPCQLSFSCSQIDIQLESGKRMQGSFRITTEEKYKPEGYVYSTDLRMLLKVQSFGGLDMEIPFQYDATGLEEGSVQEGHIYVVSNLGEYEIPYYVQVTNSLPESSLGTIKNLFHFANLAKSQWQEAVELFYSKLFVNILTGNDREYLQIYRALSGNKGNEANVDLFLEIAKKKSRTSYHVLQNAIRLENVKETVAKTLSVKKDGWGHTALSVRASGDFILLETDTLTGDDFETNTAELPFYINAAALHRGNNYGYIELTSLYETIQVPVEVIIPVKRERRQDERRRDNMKLMRLYLSFRTGEISKGEWIRECSVLITKMLHQTPNDIACRLYQVQLFLTEKRYDEASKILERISFMLEEQEVLPELEGYFYYLSSLGNQEKAELEELAKKTELLYVQDIRNWKLAWFLLYMKKQYVENDKEKWKLLQQQYEYGNVSPILFVEALQAVLRTPTVMTKLSDFELAFLAFARKHNVMTGEIRNRFVFLASKEIAYSKEIYELLTYCYQLEEKDETLFEICSILMKGNRIGEDCFFWYEKAVEQELRISRLYEYYIMSIDLGYTGKIPKIVLMYFAYHSNLDYERNAFLYANVLKYKTAYQDIYEDYLPIIEAFAKEQLAKKRINENLAYIYKTILGELLYTEEYATNYGELLFQNRVNLKCDGITAVVVVYENLTEEIRYPVYQNTTVVSLSGDNYVLVLEDREGNRFADESLYEVSHIAGHVSQMKKIMYNSAIDVKPALYLAELSGEHVRVQPENEAILLWLVECEEVRPAYRREIMLTLAEYYFEQDEIGRLDELLTKFEPAELSGKEREICIRIMVARGMYDKAFDWVRTFGAEYIDYKIIVRLCDRMLMRTDFEFEPELLKICEGIFHKGKYDETILNYLLLYKQGASHDLKSLWRAADSFNLDVHHLLETMLIQIMYSGIEIGEETNIFMEYVTYGASVDIEKAFLEKLAYQYFVMGNALNTEVFDRVLYLAQTGEELSDYCKLAFLYKEAEKNRKRSWEEDCVEFIKAWLNTFIERNMIFPFFMEYRTVLDKLELYSDRCFVEYHGNEENKVILHYVIERNDGEEEEYRKEEMQHLVGGIFLKSFILFYGEKVRYYITEEGGRQEKLTRSSVLENTDAALVDAEHRFAAINSIVVCRDMKDDVTYLGLTEEYMKKSYLVDKLFVPDIL